MTVALIELCYQNAHSPIRRSHWKMALNLMDRQGSSYSFDEIRTVVNHVNQMTNLLCEEASGNRNEVRIMPHVIE